MSFEPHPFRNVTLSPSVEEGSNAGDESRLEVQVRRGTYLCAAQP